MSEEVNIVDDSDWNRIESLMKSAIKPMDNRITEFHKRIDDRMDKLPCSEHTLSINTMEVQRTAEKEQEKEASNSRDWILRLLVAAVGVLVLLDKIGVFKSFAK